MPVPNQIVVLLALISGLFDAIPISKMEEAELVLQKMDTELPLEIRKRIVSDKELSSADHEAILSAAGNLLSPFQEKPETDQDKP